MGNTFFTADLHFNHTNIIKYCNRPFDSIAEMHNKLITNWNSKVSNKDRVYVVGDFGFGDCRAIFNCLNGSKFLIIGSHDRGNLKLLWEFVKHCYDLHIGKISIWLNHYAQRVWPRSHYGTWHLFGHSHGKLESLGKSFDVGVDVWNFSPVSFEEVQAKMDTL